MNTKIGLIRVAANFKNFTYVGFDIAKGLAVGIGNGAYLAVNTAIALAKGAMDAAKKELGGNLLRNGLWKSV